MRYLKLFETFDEEHLKDLCDMCLAYLMDDGYEYNIKDFSWLNTKVIYFDNKQIENKSKYWPYRNENIFKWGDIKDHFIPFLEMLLKDYRIKEVSMDVIREYEKGTNVEQKTFIENTGAINTLIKDRLDDNTEIKVISVVIDEKPKPKKGFIGKIKSLFEAHEEYKSAPVEVKSKLVSLIPDTFSVKVRPVLNKVSGVPTTLEVSIRKPNTTNNARSVNYNINEVLPAIEEVKELLDGRYKLTGINGDYYHGNLSQFDNQEGLIEFVTNKGRVNSGKYTFIFGLITFESKKMDEDFPLEELFACCSAREAKLKEERLKKQAEAEKERQRQAMYDEWKRSAKRQAERDQIEREVNTLYQSIISDFSSNRYSDKFETPLRNGVNAFYYKFENRKVIKLYKKTPQNSLDNNSYCLEWEESIYTPAWTWTKKFIDLSNEIIDKSGPRPQRSSGYDRYDSYGKGSSQSSGSSGQRKTDNTPPKWANHPKGGMYQTLKDTVKLREEQLKKATGSDKEALQNELNAAKRMLDNLNKKYNFESNIQNFIQFNQIFEKSKFVDTDEFNTLLDKINDGGITSLTDIEKKRLDLFSMDDEPILDIIDRMGDLSTQFKEINIKLKDLNNQGKHEEAQKIFRDEWGPLNGEMSKLEKEIESYGIELGDEILRNLMNKNRADVYGYDPDKEGDDELEMDI